MRLFGRKRAERDMSAEIEHHIACRAADLEAQGMKPAEALRCARLEFGSTERYKEECRESLGYRPLDELTGDLRYALRVVRKSPGFVATSVVVLALAIAVNTAFFALYENYVLKPLPIRAADRNFDVVAVTQDGRRGNYWARTEIDALRTVATSAFEGLYTEGTFQIRITEPLLSKAFVNAVTANYFSLLGCRPAVGRLLGEEDDNAAVAVLSDSGWRRLFQADPGVLGRTLKIRSKLFTVVGVASPAFIGTEGVVPDFWVHASMKPAMRANLEASPAGNLSGVLREGVSAERAVAELSAAAVQFKREAGRTILRLDLDPRRSILQSNTELQAAAAMIFTVFLLVLLIACANLANLHLARAAARTHEIGIRLSLGASRARVIRQLLTESILLAMIGAALGLLFAQAGVNGLQSYLLSAVSFTGIQVVPIEISWRVFLYTAAVGILAGLAFGLLPSLEATASSKKEEPAFGGRIRPKRMRDLLVTGQVAASLILLILAAVLVRNTQRLYAADPGFDLDTVFDSGFQNPTRAILDQLLQDPAVASASAVAQVPLYGARGRSPFLVDGRTELLGSNAVDENYFATFGLALVQGRGFTRSEAERRIDVAVISEATARKLWPGEGIAIGRALRIADSPRTLEVIGVVPDVISGFFFQGPDSSMVYTPVSAGSPDAVALVVRSRGGFTSTDAALRRISREMDPIPLRKVASMQRFPFEAAGVIAGALGFLALLLTCIGLYGVVSFVVAQRTREIGIQMALGADSLRIVLDIVLGSSKQVLAGIAIALPVCLMLSRLASSSQLQIRTFEWSAYLLAPALLWAIATLSCLLPARKAAAVDPMVSLRRD
jgi:macrolide transport system ATP-binding/permease protein